MVDDDEHEGNLCFKIRMSSNCALYILCVSLQICTTNYILF
jgi:hypothetical protein